MNRIVAGLRHLMLAAVASGGIAAAVAPAAAQSPTVGRTYRVGFAQLVDHPALNATRQGFVDGLKSAGFEIGKSLIFEYQNAQGDVGVARNIAEKFLADRVDLLAPCTTPVALATIRVAKDSKTPVAFGCVTNPIQVGVLQSTDKATGTNVTGFYTVPPVGPNFEMFLAIKPNIRTIGTIYNSGETNSEALNKLAKAEAEKRGITWMAKTVASSAEVKNAADALVGRVDAIVTLQDNTIASAYEAVIKATGNAKIPWFAFDVLAVERGAIAGLAQHQYQNGVDWARKVAVPVLEGVNPGAIVPVEAAVFETHINVAAAKSVGLIIPYPLIKQATKVFGQ